MSSTWDLLAQLAPDHLQGKVQLAGALLGGGDTGASKMGRTGSAPAPGPNGNWEQYAKQQALHQYGYTRPEWRQLDSIIERESGWNPNAVNPNGGAYGIPQILPSAHPDTHLQNDPEGQVKWLFDYIQSRYNGIQGALQHKDQTGWY